MATIRLRGGSTAEWDAANPILANREMAIEFVEGGAPRLKVGNGVAAWNALPYVFGGDMQSLRDLLASNAEDEGADTIGFANPTGELFNNAETVGMCLRFISDYALFVNQGTALELREAISPNDRVVVGNSDDDTFALVNASAVFNVGMRTVSGEAEYVLKANETVVVMTRATTANLVVQEQIVGGYMDNAAVDVWAEQASVKIRAANTNVIINGVAGGEVTIPTGGYRSARLMRGKAPNIWYVRGDGLTTTADTTAPVITGFSPANAAANVATSAPLSFDLNEPCDFGASGTITLEKNDSGWTTVETWNVSTEIGAGAGQCELTNGGTRVVLHPTLPLSPGVPFALTWSAGAVKDKAGNNIAANASRTVWAFSTVAPAITQPTPVSGDGSAYKGVIPAGTGTINLPIPTGLQNDDQLLLIMACTSTLTGKAPAAPWVINPDWTAQVSPSSVIAELRVDGGAIPATVTVGRVMDRAIPYVFVVLRAAETDNQNGARGTVDGLPDAPVLSQIAANCGRLLVALLDDDDVDLSPPAPYSLIVRNNAGLYTGVGASICVGWRAPTGSAGDSHDPGAFTGSGSDQWWCLHRTYKYRAIP